MVAGYWASVALVDETIGMVLEALDSDAALRERTMVVATSDHGDLNAEHGLFSKFLGCYDAETRVPLLARLPGRVKQGQVVDDLVESIDLIPTMIEAGQCAGFPDHRGRSLWPLLRGESTGTHRDYVISSTGGWYEEPGPVRPQGLMLRNKSHKLVFYPTEPFGELYGMQADPLEINNLYNDPQYADMRHDMQEELLRFMISSDYRARPGDPRWTERSTM
jgi:arylsulfatase A-like enzyme